MDSIQHSFEILIIIVSVAMQHLVPHDEHDIVGPLQTERVPQRQSEEQDPKGPRALIDGPIDSRVAALANATGCSQATRNAHAHRGLFPSESIRKAHVLHGQLQC